MTPLERSQWGFVGVRWPLWLLSLATSLMSAKGGAGSAQWIPFSKMEPDFSVYSSDAFYSERSPFEGTHSVNYIPADSLSCHCLVLVFGLLHGAFGIYHLQTQGFFSHLRFQLLYLLQSLSSLALLGSRLALHRGTLAPLPWLALGRAAAQLLQLQGLSVACGARQQEAMPVALLGGLQWMQLGMSSVATEANPKGQHYGNGLVVRGQHWLHLGPPQSAAQSWRPLMDRMYMPLLPFFTKGAVDMGMFWFLKALPKNLEIVSLASWDDKTLLLRIGHQFGVDEDSELSKPATVDLQTLFAGAHITFIQERGLGGTISSDEVEKRRITWPLEAGGNAGNAEVRRPRDGRHGRHGATATTVTLGPLQIRTFLLEMEKAGANSPIVI